MIEQWIEGLFILLQWQNLILLLGGTIVGMFFGALPGVGAVLSISLLLPVTFGMKASSALIFLGAVYSGCIYGGSIPSVLINAPGTDTNAATVLDGYPMAQNGEAHIALGASAASACFGGIFSTIVLCVSAPLISKVALALGPAEYFSLCLVALTIIARSATGVMLKGLIISCFGLLVSFIGMSPISGIERLTFGITYLINGIPLVPSLIGLFAVSEMFSLLIKGDTISQIAEIKGSVFEGVKTLAKYPVNVLRSSLIGVLIGALPGVGGVTSTFLAYMEAMRSSKTPEKYGKGYVEGVIAPECANNATIGGALIPTITLGIPGNATTAVLLGGLMIWGLRPGPQLFSTNAHIIYSFFLSLFLANVIFVIIGLAAAKYLVKITVLKSEVLSPLIIAFCLVGTYSLHNDINDVILMLLFALIGYHLKKLNYPVVCFVIVLVLGPIMEVSFCQALLISGGSYMIFFTRPISVGFIIFGVLNVVWPYLRSLRGVVSEAERNSEKTNKLYGH
ncbi:MAG: tripartite tricarboxylate transporter permease [Gammaproteobacteria bacterium]|nr:tripartite tricarboxylate transporter permease [Gammaproteobacteria bacterium]